MLKDVRSRNLSLNILLALVFKGLNLFASFLLVPLTIGYLDTDRFGVWITLSSIIGWIGYFDLGIGNGLRNKLTEAIATGRTDYARKLVSTAYFLVFLLVAALLFLYLVFIQFFDISWMLNMDTFGNALINRLFTVLFILFLLRFLIKLIKDVDMAHHSSSNTILYDLIASVISLIAVFLLTRLSEPSLMKLCFSLSFAPILTFLAASLWLFNRKYKAISPGIRHIDMSVAHAIFGLGMKILFIQLANVIFFSTDAVIISKTLGAAEVTPYAVSNKYFGIQLVVFSIIVLPYWNAFTEAHLKGEITWIRRILKRLLLFWGASLIAAAVMLLIAGWFYAIWVGSEVTVPPTLDLLMVVFTLLATFNLIFSTFLFGIGKINLLLAVSLLSAIANIPLSLYFCTTLNMGVNGILTGSIIALIPSNVLMPLQSYALLRQPKPAAE